MEASEIKQLRRMPLMVEILSLGIELTRRLLFRDCSTVFQPKISGTAGAISTKRPNSIWPDDSVFKIHVWVWGKTLDVTEN